MPNISISKGNHQTLQFRQLIEYNMRYIFLEELCTKYGAETSITLFCKKPKMIISRDKQSEVLRSLFLLYVQVEDYQRLLTFRHWPLGFNLYEIF